jgi:transposase
LTIPRLVRAAAGFRPGGRTDVTNANRVALKTLARRVLELDAEIDRLDELLTPLVAETVPALVERIGVGTDTAGALLVAAGENTSRIHDERSFARLCGAAPLDASSGKQQRHRLSRGGDRQANSALRRIVIPASPMTLQHATTSNDDAPKARPKPKPSAASSDVARELYACLPGRLA